MVRFGGILKLVYCKDFISTRKALETMTVSYIGLWKLLLEKGLQKQDLVEQAGLSSATVAKMGKGEPVSNKVVDKICTYLNCNPSDIISYE